MDSHDEFCEKVIVDVGPGNIESGCGCKERWHDTEIARLRVENERLKRLLACDICSGPEDAKRIDCACRGTGEMWRAFQYCRERLAALEAENERLKNSLAVQANQIIDAAFKIAALEAELAQANH